MKRFCTNCGTELGADTRFCTKCGTENPVPGAATKKDRRWLWWVLALILVYVAIMATKLARIERDLDELSRDDR